MASSAAHMTPQERTSSFSLASIFALRMFGLFIILPVFAVYARELPGGDSETLVGITLGIYGLTQGLLQIPFGVASDRLGRKPVIIFGLIIFALGSFLAASGANIWIVMLGRMLQGAGAISAAVTAFIADSVRVQVLTKAMAMVGASIGLTFALSLLISPPLTKLWGVSGLFTLTGISALIAVLVVKFVVPPAPQSAIDEKNEHRSWRKVVCDPQLVRLNIGIFVLHAVLTAIFVVIPTRLVYMRLPSEHHWWVYLPAVIAGFALMAPPLIFGEKKQAVVRVMRFMIGFLTVAFVLFAYLIHSIWEIAFLLGIFFIGFNVLEATLPNLVSRIAPAADRGLALGVYNTTQNIGLFVGGALGGDGADLGFGGEAGGFLREQGVAAANGSIWDAGGDVGQDAMDGQVGVAADGRREMAIIGESQAVVADGVGQVFGFGHRAQEAVRHVLAVRCFPRLAEECGQLQRRCFRRKIGVESHQFQ